MFWSHLLFGWLYVFYEPMALQPAWNDRVGAVVVDDGAVDRHVGLELHPRILIFLVVVGLWLLLLIFEHLTQIDLVFYVHWAKRIANDTLCSTLRWSFWIGHSTHPPAKKQYKRRRKTHKNKWWRRRRHKNVHSTHNLIAFIRARAFTQDNRQTHIQIHTHTYYIWIYRWCHHIIIIQEQPKISYRDNFKNRKEEKMEKRKKKRDRQNTSIFGKFLD